MIQRCLAVALATNLHQARGLAATAAASGSSHCPSGGRLAGQRVLVTGAGRGIGRAIALLCAGEGAQVAIASRTAGELAETEKAASSAHPVAAALMAVPCDVTSETEVEAMVAAVVEEFGGIDILINNAGGAGAGGKAPAHTQSLDAFRNLLELNVVSVLGVSGAVLRAAMLPARAGRIVMISSRAGKLGIGGMAPYSASKFALEGLAATLAEEVRSAGIEVNTLSPGMVDTASFPKPPGKPGVRSAESVAAGLLAVLEGGVTGHYLHVDELDAAVAAGLGASAALKPINEPPFVPGAR